MLAAFKTLFNLKLDQKPSVVDRHFNYGENFIQLHVKRGGEYLITLIVESSCLISDLKEKLKKILDIGNFNIDIRNFKEERLPNDDYTLAQYGLDDEDESTIQMSILSDNIRICGKYWPTDATILVDSMDKIKIIKSFMADVMHFDQDNEMLSIDGRVLDDDKRLLDYNWTQTIIHVIFKYESKDITLFVTRSTTGPTMTVKRNHLDTILSVKKEISLLYEINVDFQRLIYHDVLKNNHKLIDYHIKHGSSLELILCVEGGGHFPVRVEILATGKLIDIDIISLEICKLKHEIEKQEEIPSKDQIITYEDKIVTDLHSIVTTKQLNDIEFKLQLSIISKRIENKITHRKVQFRIVNQRLNLNKLCDAIAIDTIEDVRRKIQDECSEFTSLDDFYLMNEKNEVLLDNKTVSFYHLDINSQIQLTISNKVSIHLFNGDNIGIGIDNKLIIKDIINAIQSKYHLLNTKLILFKNSIYLHEEKSLIHYNIKNLSNLTCQLFVNVFLSNLQICDINVRSTTTISEIKQLIISKRKNNLSTITILLDGRKLSDNKTLWHYNFPAGRNLYALVTPVQVIDIHVTCESTNQKQSLQLPISQTVEDIKRQLTFSTNKGRRESLYLNDKLLKDCLTIFESHINHNNRLIYRTQYEDKCETMFHEKEGFYRLSNARPRGVCVIINNDEFHDKKKFPPRIGSQLDAERLIKTFNYLGYLIVRENNLIGIEITSLICQISHLNHSDYDSVVVCILSHGINGFVFGVDGGAVEVCDPLKYLHESSTLNGVPKLTLLQACRVHGNTSSQTNQSIKYPPGRDTLIFNSTTPYHISYRDRNNGSIFIREFCTELIDRKGYYCKDIHTIVTRVTNRVDDIVKSINGEDQVPEMKSTLRRTFQFSHILLE